MKPSFIFGALVGYVLGARAGRERYEDIVAVARRVAGSQTVQATAGVLEARAGAAAGRIRDRLISKVGLGSPRAQAGYSTVAANGHPAAS